MIIFYHNGTSSVEAPPGLIISKQTMPEFLLEAANKFPDELLIWCHIQLKTQLNLEKIPEIFHHKKIMASYATDEYLPDEIGYVEEGPFIPVCKTVTYTTWRMHSWVGGIHAQVLLAMQNYLNTRQSFDYFLHSVAKKAMPLGLFCYSEPKLLKSLPDLPVRPRASTAVLFRFVAQHYKKRWCFLLLLNLILYEKKWPLFPFLKSLFHIKKSLPDKVLSHLTIKDKTPESLGSIDVVIPTLGRKKYLYNVLKDLSVQTHLPQKVIIVEQNPEPESVSELDYLQTDKWPFTIVHHFTHQTGACRARNLALQEVTADWVFLADDDIRFNENFLKLAMVSILGLALKSATFGCFRKGQKPHDIIPKQWSTFGSGCSLMSSKLSKKVAFNTAYEQGYGEDADFGMQLRKEGVDVIYFPEPSILHIKAPTGGFRTKPMLPWQDDKIRPKPSPTVMLFKQLHQTREQILGYKTLLAIKFYKHQPIKNLFSYLKIFKKSWEASEEWAKHLQKKIPKKKPNYP